MASEREVPYLRLVPPPVSISDRRPAGQRPPPASQATLFPSPRPNLLVFVAMIEMRGRSFCELLESIRPSLIFDLRPVPYFDLHGLTRKRFFKLIESLDSVYHDVAGLLGVTSSRDGYPNPELIAETLLEIRASTPSPKTHRSLVILVDHKDTAVAFAQALPARLEPPRKRRWEIFIAPR